MSTVYDLGKPRIYDSAWYVFPHTTLVNLDLSDCNDTIEGICQHTDTVEQCINLCAKDPDNICKGGYFIQTPGNDSNLCVPLRSYVQEQTVPFYRLRTKDYYPEMKHVDSSVFLSTIYPFPPNMANTLFFMDHCTLKSVNTGLQLGMESNSAVTQNVSFSEKNPVNVQFLPITVTRSQMENYIAIKNGDSVAINIPHTALILRTDESNNMVRWLMRASVVSVPNNTFHIHSANLNKKEGEVLNYGEQFYFTYHGRLLGLSKKLGTLQLYSADVSDAIRDNQNVLFELTPQIEVYYCDKTSCKSVPLSQTDTKGIAATYKGQIVSRSPGCWGICGTKRKPWWVLVIALGVIILIIVVVIRYRNQ